MSDAMLITNIQRCSFHDGPGIRTTIFMKGCSLCCPWCCNPENIKSRIQKYRRNGEMYEYGKYMTVDEVYQEIIKDVLYYGEYFVQVKEETVSLDKIKGGVTFSGGEALLQINQLEPLLMKLKERNIHIAFETSLYVPLSNLEKAIPYTDLFIVDVKILGYEECADILNGNINVFLGNLKVLSSDKRKFIVRIPVIGGYTDTEHNIREIINLLKCYAENIIKIELLREHNLGREKYLYLKAAGEKVTIPQGIGVSNDFLKQYKREIMNNIPENIPVEILSI